MAEVVGEFPKDDRKVERYPWEEWLDGRIWKLTPAEDFTISLPVFRVKAWQAGGNRGLKVETRVSGEHLYLRAKRKT